jgi:hypothetical protein
LSIQETLDEAKKEFSSDEQMLASAFKLEKFYKKYKILILGTITALVLFFVGKGVMGFMEEKRLAAANEAYLSLNKNGDNTQAYATLQAENPALFELYSYKKAVEQRDTKTLETLSSSSNEIIADMSAYHLSLFEGKASNSKLYEEIALVNNAYLLIKEGKIEEAKNQLDLITEESAVFNISKIIKHYSIKGQ